MPPRVFRFAVPVSAADENNRGAATTGRGHIEAQAVDVVVAQPHRRVVVDELARLLPAVVGPGVAP
jgi:hypothetical protein